jgi:hypothetical protein
MSTFITTAAKTSNPTSQANVVIVYESSPIPLHSTSFPSSIAEGELGGGGGVESLEQIKWGGWVTSVRPKNFDSILHVTDKGGRECIRTLI